MFFPFIKRSHSQQPKKESGVSIQDAIVFAMSKDYDITDGGEFIDDGMRMKEQPLTSIYSNDTQPGRPYHSLQIQIQSQSQSLRPVQNQNKTQNRPPFSSQRQLDPVSISRHVAPDPWRYFPATTPVVSTATATPQIKTPVLTGPIYNNPEEVVKALKNEGYTENFATDTVSLYSGDQDMRFHPGDFSIDKTFRFNGNCGPNGNPIVYAITSTTGVKGTLTDTTGTCALHPDMVKKVYINK